MDTQIIWTVYPVSLVSILTRFHCITLIFTQIKSKENSYKEIFQ